MNDALLSTASVEKLVERYRQAAVAFGEASAAHDPDRANLNHDLVSAVYRELRRRGAAAQRALLPLLQDPVDAVRSRTAALALEYAPEEAEPVLTALAEGSGPRAFSAMMTLREWRKGALRFP